MSAVDFVRRLPSLGKHYAISRRRLRAIAYSWCRDRTLAEDLVQETFLKALTKLAQLRDVDSLDAWLFNILLNCWRDHLRRQRPTEDVDELYERDDVLFEDERQRLDMVEAVKSAVAQLPEGQRQVLCLVDLEGYSYAEVSKMLNIPTGTVTSRVSRAREQMRAILMESSASEAKVIAMRRMG